MSNDEKLSANMLKQSDLIQELFMQITKTRPDLQSGLFYTSNKDAFAISEDVVSGVLKESNPNWVESLNLAYEDILRISESDVKSLESLEELDMPVEEFLEFINEYDHRAAKWDYNLEDMRQPDFIGIFCPECDQEIGGELDCPSCFEPT